MRAAVDGGYSNISSAERPPAATDLMLRMVAFMRQCLVHRAMVCVREKAAMLLPAGQGHDARQWLAKPSEA